MEQAVHQRGEGSRPGTRWVEEHWTEVTPGVPCAVCDATEGCGVMRDERFARCAARPSEWPMAAGGWLHHVAAPPASES